MRIPELFEAMIPELFDRSYPSEYNCVRITSTITRKQDPSPKSHSICRVHKPGVPNKLASLQNPAQQAAQRQHAPGSAQIHNDRPRQRSDSRPEDLTEVGPHSDSDPLSPTEDTPDLCSLLFPDRYSRSRLGTTNRERPLNVGPGSRRSR